MNWILIFGILTFFCFLGFVIAFLHCKKLEKNIYDIRRQLENILDHSTEEKIMSFTESKEISKLIYQINRILEDRQKMKADYKRAEILSKKMLSNISHDIRTPLTVILGYLEILEKNSTEHNETIKKIHRKAIQLMNLIHEFFTLSKIEAGDTNLSLTKLSINEICRQNIIDFYHILTEQEFQVDINIPEQELYTYGNEEALRRILFNLITNAIRYGGGGKYLGVFLREDDNFLFIDIVDHGKGIDAKNTEHVFDRLYTLDDSRNRTMEGTGLGLTISKTLAKKMHGNIILQSIPNIKTTFTVKLPKFLSERNS